MRGSFPIMGVLIFAFLCFIPIIERKRCEKGDVLALILLAVFFFIVSGAITAMKISAFSAADLKDGNYTICGTVTDVSQGEKITTISLNEVSLTDFEEKTNVSSNLQLYINELTGNILVGDRISCYAYVNLQDINGEFSTYLILNDYKYYAFTTEKDIFVIGKTNNFFLKTRIYAENVLHRYLKNGADELAIGLLFGNTDGMEEADLNAFRTLGIAHIFAVSGLHIGFLCGIILFLLRKLERRNPIRFLLPTIFVFLYAGICGFSPSSVRAAIMCSTSLLLTMIGAPNDRLNGILFSAVVILLLNPFDLFSYGFQLSYVCVLSLVMITPIIRDLLYFLPKKIGEGISISVGVQLGVFPLQMMLFGYASPIAIVLNLILVPIISIIYSILLILLLLLMVFPIFGCLLGACSVVLNVLKNVLIAISDKNMLISGWNFNQSFVSYYLGFLFASPILNIKGKIKLGFFAIFIVTCVILTIFTIK